VAAPRVIREAGELRDFLAQIGNAPFIALDTETSGLDPHKDKVLLIQFGTATDQALVDAQAVGAAAIAEIFHPDRIVVMHNATFDLKMLQACYGAALDLTTARVTDTLLSELILRNGRRTDIADVGFALKALAQRYAGMDLDKTVREGFYGITDINVLGEAELRYAARDVEATWKVYASQLPLLEKDGLMRVAGIESAATIAFAEMELSGAPIDVEAWTKLVDEAKKDSATARKGLDREFWGVVDRDLFGHTTLNYESEHDVTAALKRLGVEISTLKREALLATGHPAAKALAEYREHQKIVSTYGEGFLQHVHPKTKRVHPRFSAIGAMTGRVSCSEPNLQNIPATSAFRACFRAPPGRRLITADYVGAELRIIAEASKDPVFLRTLGAGGDLHAIVASQIFGKPVSKTENPDLRARAKAINFGLAYGMGAQGLANQIALPLQEAEQLLERYFRAFPRIRDYLNGSARHALARNVAETMGGRRYWFTDMRRDGKDEGTMIRVAKNMPIQGTNADMSKLAMGRIIRALRAEKLDAFLINMVHDELVVEASSDCAERVREIVVREMISGAAEFIRSVPVEVDAKISETWTK
jgi:DNA polymerase I